MRTLESIRKRIESASELLSVVKTMKVMAAVSIRQCERAVASLAEYNRTIEMGLQILLRREETDIQLPGEPTGGRFGAVVFGSNQGMVGQFNQRVAAHAMEAMDRLQIEDGDRSVLATGPLVAAHLEEAGQPVEESLRVPWSVAGITPVVQETLVRVDEWRSARGIDHVVLFYNHPQPGAAYQPHTLSLLPLDVQWLESLREKEWPCTDIPTFTVDGDQLFSALLRQYVFIVLYRAFAESLASENAHRLASMEAAEKNIEDRLSQLRTEYNQVRQSSITEELLDIVSGFEALTGGYV